MTIKEKEWESGGKDKEKWKQKNRCRKVEVKDEEEKMIKKMKN